MLVIDEIVETLRKAGYQDVYPMQLPANVGEGIVVRYLTSLTTAYYMDGSRSDDVTYQVFVRRRSGVDAKDVALEVMSLLVGKLPNCKDCRLFSNDRQLLPQQLPVSDSGYYDAMVQFVAEIITN